MPRLEIAVRWGFLGFAASLWLVWIDRVADQTGVCDLRLFGGRFTILSDPIALTVHLTVPVWVFGSFASAMLIHRRGFVLVDPALLRPISVGGEPALPKVCENLSANH